MEKNDSMPHNLSDSYDAYGDFNRSTYFTICYNTLPSNLELRIPLKENKENMEAVLATIDFQAISLTPVFKTWLTKDSKDASLSEDYPYEYLFKSKTKSLLIWVALDRNEIYIDFFYDLNDLALEQWIISTNHKIRLKFGESQAPTFKILSRNDRTFYTENIQTGNFKETDITTLYNDDFPEIHSIVVDAIQQEKAGLILLHGSPGTGKTSYIKHLISNFRDRSFIFIQNEFVQELLKPEFISFLIGHRNSLLIIEDAEKIIMPRESSSQESVVSTILQLTDGLFSDYLNIKVICTFNSKVDKIDKALLRKGRMIANYEFKPLSKEKANNLATSLGFEPQNDAMSLADIFNLNKKGFAQLPKPKIGF